MANQMYVGRFDTEEEMNAFYHDLAEHFLIKGEPIERTIVPILLESFPKILLPGLTMTIP